MDTNIGVQSYTVLRESQKGTREAVDKVLKKRPRKFERKGLQGSTEEVYKSIRVLQGV